jgi:uncharacterized membrane protein YccC
MRERLRDPVFWSDATQLIKTAVAATLAWVLAVQLVGDRQSFLAPWAALLVVHATVYRTFSQGAQQVGAAVAGVLLAWGAGNLIGPEVAALFVVVLIGLLIGRSRWLEGEAATAAATALIVLTTGLADDQHLLVDRLLDTGIGIAVGLVINVVVWPPLRRRTAIAALDALDDRIGELLVEIADGLVGESPADEVEGWLQATSDLDDELEQAWSHVRQTRESALLNPRRSARTLRNPEVWIVLLRHMEQAVAEIRSMVRTLERFFGQHAWDPDFRDGYVAAVRRGGRAIEDADADAIRDCRAELDRLVDLRDSSGPVPDLWPAYGGLVVSLANILEAMEEVAAANPLDQPPLPLRFRRRRSRGRSPG